MATIGLRDLYRAPITIGTSGAEEYGTPVRMAKAISAELSVEVAEAILYADDGADEVVKEFVSGEITLNVNDLLPADLAALLGQKQDADKVVYGADTDLLNITNALDARVDMLEAVLFNDITTNPFLILFDDLDGVTSTGIWNESLQRIEC